SPSPGRVRPGRRAGHRPGQRGQDRPGNRLGAAVLAGRMPGPYLGLLETTLAIADGTRMNIAVIGTGYVGLVTVTCFAESGNDVIGIDIDASKIAMFGQDQLPIYEPGLLDLLRRNRRSGRLRFTTRYEDGIPPAQMVFLAVGTPQDASGEADLRYLW